MKFLLNGINFKYHLGGGRFHIIPQYYKFYLGLCMKIFPQVLLIGNQRYQVPLFRYINRSDEVSHLVRVGKVIWYMKYFMMPVKRAEEAVGLWTEEKWDLKRVNSLYNMVSGRFNFKINKRFAPLSWSLFVKDLHRMRGYIIGELNEEQEQV